MASLALSLYSVCANLAKLHVIPIPTLSLSGLRYLSYDLYLSLRSLWRRLGYFFWSGWGYIGWEAFLAGLVGCFGAFGLWSWLCISVFGRALTALSLSRERGWMDVPAENGCFRPALVQADSDVLHRSRYV